MKTYKIIVEQIVTNRELDLDDLYESPAGSHYHRGNNEDEALDNFHACVPISCLDHFTIDASEYGVEEAEPEHRAFCPVCCEGRLDLKQDAIITYDYRRRDKLKISSTDELDNIWLECENCCATSEEDNEIKKIYNRLQESFRRG